MLRFIPVVLLLPLLAHPSTLTLEEARRKAIERNHDLKAERHSKEEAAARRKMAEAMRLPRLDLRSSYIRTDEPASAFALTLNQKRFSMADFSVSDPNSPDTLDTFLTSVSLSVPLYTGGQIRGAIGAAREMEAAAGERQRRAEQELVVKVTRAYLGTLLADEYVLLMEKALETVHAHVEMAQSYFDTGMIVKSDLLRARVEEARVRDDLLQAKQRVDLARLGLGLLIGSDLDETVALQSVAPPGKSKPYDLTSDTAAALSSRPDLRMMHHMVEAARLNERMLRARRLPSLGVSVSRDFYDDSPLGDRGDATTIAVGLTLPLYAGGALRAEAAEGRAQYERAVEQRAAMEEGIAFQVRSAAARMRQARSRMEVAEGNAEAAAMALSIVEERYRKGIMKMTDLMDADTALIEARTRKLQASYDYLLAREEYLLAVGKEDWR